MRAAAQCNVNLGGMQSVCGRVAPGSEGHTEAACLFKLTCDQGHNAKPARAAAPRVPPSASSPRSSPPAARITGPDHGPHCPRPIEPLATGWIAVQIGSQIKGVPLSLGQRTLTYTPPPAKVPRAVTWIARLARSPLLLISLSHAGAQPVRFLPGRQPHSEPPSPHKYRDPNPAVLPTSRLKQSPIGVFCIHTASSSIALILLRTGLHDTRVDSPWFCQNEGYSLLIHSIRPGPTVAWGRSSVRLAFERWLGGG